MVDWHCKSLWIWTLGILVLKMECWNIGFFVENENKSRDLSPQCFQSIDQFENIFPVKTAVKLLCSIANIWISIPVHAGQNRSVYYHVDRPHIPQYHLMIPNLFPIVLICYRFHSILSFVPVYYLLCQFPFMLSFMKYNCCYKHLQFRRPKFICYAYLDLSIESLLFEDEKITSA